MTKVLFSRFELVICLAVNIIITLNISLLMEGFDKYTTESLYEKSNFTDYFTNSNIKEYIYKKMNFNYGKLIKKIFK